LNSVHVVLLAARFIYLLILIIFYLNIPRKTRHLINTTSKLQFSPNFTLNRVADSNYRGKCDVSGFLIFEWTLDGHIQLGPKKIVNALYIHNLQFCRC
jgi:hypothetical protein